MFKKLLLGMKKRLSIALSIYISLMAINPGMLHVYAAANEIDYVVEDQWRVPIPKTYTIDKVINTIGSMEEEEHFFKEPLDIFVSDGGYIYVADTGNNRIVKLNKKGEALQVFRGPEDKPFKGPEGIFVDNTEDIYVADTGNERIVHLSPEGKFVEEFVAPTSDLLDENVAFSVSKIVISQTGYIYAIRGENIMVMDAHNRFRGFLGQTKIGFSAVEALLRVFASEDQQKFMKKRLAATYMNIDLGADGMLYTTSMDRTEGELKRLNSVGNNTYRKYKNISDTGSFSPWAKIKKKIKDGNYIKKSFRYGETVNDNYEFFLPIFRDICVDQNGIVTAVEELTGKIYQYDKDGNALTVFGGLGEKQGTFIRPSSIAVDSEGKIYVLDKLSNNIQIFAPTQFIQLVHAAVTQYSEGNYEEAYNLWYQVLDINENYELAHIGLANALYKQEKWEEAMDEFQIANDRAGYSKAFAEYRYEVFRENFFLVIAILFASLFLAIFILIKLIRNGQKCADILIHQKNTKLSIKEGILMGFHVILHPIETFDTIKNNKERVNLWSAAIIFIAVFLTRICYIFIVHYPLADIDVKNANIIFEAVKILLPPLTWVAASFAVTSILDGESKITDIFVASSYTMIPYIIVRIPLMFLSNVLCLNEKGWFSASLYFALIWVLLLYFISTKVLNDYTIIKSITTYIISGIAILIIWFIALLLYALSVRLMQFIQGIMIEIQLSWF